MITRRIIISACALSLAVPAAAGAAPATNPPEAKGPYGVTATTYPKLAKAKGPYGTTVATYPKLLKAKGPYGTTTTPSSQDTTTRATAHAAGASTDDGMNDWRTAAISEAALLAALGLGSALLLAGRRRVPRLGTT